MIPDSVQPHRPAPILGQQVPRPSHDLDTSEVVSPISERAGAYVFRSLMLGSLGCIALVFLVAIGPSVFLNPRAGDRAAWPVFIVVGLIGALELFFSVLIGRRVWLRRQYGLREQNIVIRERKHDWHPLMRLADIEEIKVELGDELREDPRKVLFIHEGRRTEVGPFEGAHAWAQLVAAQASEIQGRDVSLKM